jgi:hypothetical protein
MAREMDAAGFRRAPGEEIFDAFARFGGLSFNELLKALRNRIIRSFSI